MPPSPSKAALPSPVDRGRQHVHRRRADEAGDEEVGRAVVEVERRADLLDAPSCMTTILSAMVIASIWSWVT